MVSIFQKKNTQLPDNADGFIIVWEDSKTKGAELVQCGAGKLGSCEKKYREQVFSTYRAAKAWLETDGSEMVRRELVQGLVARIYPVFECATLRPRSSRDGAITWEEETK